MTIATTPDITISATSTAAPRGWRAILAATNPPANAPTVHATASIALAANGNVETNCANAASCAGFMGSRPAGGG